MKPHVTCSAVDIHKFYYVNWAVVMVHAYSPWEISSNLFWRTAVNEGDPEQFVLPAICLGIRITTQTTHNLLGPGKLIEFVCPQDSHKKGRWTKATSSVFSPRRLSSLYKLRGKGKATVSASKIKEHISSWFFLSKIKPPKEHIQHFSIKNNNNPSQ